MDRDRDRDRGDRDRGGDRDRDRGGDRDRDRGDRDRGDRDRAPSSVIISPPSAPGRESTRLEDLYRLPMPKLFALAEREGVTEHTGMNRGQLIMIIVRRQIERGVTVKGSGTLPHRQNPT